MADSQPDRSLRVVVVGGSLAGLTTALALARVGCRVDVLERSGPHPRTGGALVATFGELSPVIGARHAATAVGHPGRGRGSSGDPTLWTTLREGLRSAVDDEPLVTLQHDSRVRSVHADDQEASVTTENGRTLTGDLVIGADGHRSLVRRALDPDHPHATYAGYSLWIGMVKESELSRARPSRPGLYIDSSGPHYLLGYPMADDDGPDRTLGWAWYDATRNHLFRQTGSVTGRVVQHTLRAEDIPDTTYRELAGEARQHWPSPWREAIVESITRREVTGIPIAEYVPGRLASGRLAIVGNAAHVPTPMTGSGFAASVADAGALARALDGADTAQVPASLLEYEEERLSGARELVLSGQQFSRSFAIES
jgi:2-polyprenyl-6-methoxyphenol hydroxylase-like FAD-dependent oxidoreductase